MPRKASEGGCPGFAPTGYRYITIGDETEVEVEPTLGPLVFDALRLAGRKGTSFQKILAELTPKGLVSHNGEPMHPSALRGVLTSPFYVGMICYRGKRYEGNYEGLVTPSMFDRAGRKRSRWRSCANRTFRDAISRRATEMVFCHPRRQMDRG